MATLGSPASIAPQPKKTVSLKAKLAVSLLSLLFVNTVYFYVGIGAFREMRGYVITLYDKVVMSGTYAQMARNDFAQISASITLAVVTKSPEERAKIAEKRKDLLETFNDDLNIIKERSLSASDGERVALIQSSVKDLESATSAWLAQLETLPAPSEKTRLSLVHEWLTNPVRVKISDSLADLSDHVVADGYNFRLNATERSTLITTASVVCSIAVLILNILCLGYLLFSIIPHLRRLTSIARDIADGAFSRRVPVATTDEFGVLGSTFNGMLDILEQRDAQIHAQLVTTNAMLNSLSQGFLMVDRDGLCLPNYSQVCRELLECDPAGRPLHEVLKLSGPALARFNDWWTELMKSADLFEILSDVGQKIYPHSQGRTIELNYRPLCGADGDLTHMIMIATDTTAEVKAREIAHREQAFSRMVVKLTQNRRQFSKFLIDVNNMLARMSRDPALLDETLRMIHTIKGGAASLSMLNLKECAHRCESKLIDRARSAASPPELEIDLQSVTMELREVYKLTLRELQETCAFFINSDSSTREFSTRKILEFYQLLLETSGDRQLSQTFIESFLFEPIQNLISPYNETIHEIAKRQSKEINDLTIVGGDLTLYAERYTEFFNSLVHVFRNAVDHGVESPDHRRELGKPSAATIRVEFSRTKLNNSSWIRIAIGDDGRGIQPNRLREKLKDLGADVSSETDAQLIQHVFDANLSTATTVTDISGRGIGLNAVRASAESLGGTVSVESVVGAGTTFVILIPETGAELTEISGIDVASADSGDKRDVA